MKENMLVDLLKQNGTTVNPALEAKLKEIQNFVMKNHTMNKIQMGKPFRSTDSESSYQIKKNEKFFEQRDST